MVEMTAVNLVVCLVEMMVALKDEKLVDLMVVHLGENLVELRAGLMVDLKVDLLGEKLVDYLAVQWAVE